MDIDPSFYDTLLQTRSKPCDLALFQQRRITAQPWWEGTLEDHLVKPLVGKGALERLFSTLLSRILKTPSDDDSTTALGRLYQCLSVLTVKSSLLTLK